MKVLERVLRTGDFITSQWTTCFPATSGRPPLFRVTLGEHYTYADPILLLTGRIKNQRVISASNHAASSASSWRTTPVRQSYQLGFLRLRSILFGERTAVGNWKPYTRISVFGTISGYQTSVSTFGAVTATSGWYSSSSSIGSLPVTIHNSNDVSFITFENLRAIVVRLSSVTNVFKRRAPGTNNEFTCTISNLTITKSRISYTGFGSSRIPNTNIGSDIGPYHIVVTSDDEGRIKITQSGLNSIKDVNYGSNATWQMKPSPIQSSLQMKLSEKGVENEFVHAVIKRSHHSISGAAAGLNHTQGVALRKMLGDVSRNFETLVESPGIPEVLKQAITWVPDLAKSLGSAGSVGSAVARIVAAICAGRLAWLFAGKPTIESVIDAVSSAKQTLPKYESTLTLSSDLQAFGSLQKSLQDYILLEGMLVSDVREYKITFHTECAARVSLSSLTDGLAGVFANLRRYGIVPEPKIIWALQPFSFIFDMFVPMSSYIDAAQAYFKSYASSLKTIGHSVFIEVQHIEGWTYAIYIRSENSADPIDLVPQAWNPASGVYLQAAVPLSVLAVMGFYRKTIR